MPRVDSETKRKRLELVHRLLSRNPRGLSEREIDEHLGLGRRNINNYLHELETEGKVYKEEGKLLWYALPYHETRLRRLELTPEEAMTLYLATRLLVKQHDKRNESAEVALTKLAEALTHGAGVGREIHQAALELAHRPGEPEYSRIFRTVMQSYIYHHKLQLTYAPLNGKPFETIFSPYLLEPSAIGYSTYLIGHSSIVSGLRTYKLERIQKAALTREEYRVPEDFPGLEYLRSAWSIISGEDTIPIELRFRSPRAAKRVRESTWHPSQKIEDDPENPGGCIWTAKIADLTDFKPWVRSWGADVEVVAPDDLRAELEREVKRMARVYGVGCGEQVPLYEMLWAKTDQAGRTDETHALIHHMLDVAQVATVLWDRTLPAATRNYFSNKLAIPPEDTRKWIGFIAALHDLGKASPVFQALHPPSRRALEERGLTFPEVRVKRRSPHGIITAQTLLTLLPQLLTWDPFMSEQLAHAVGGHHGSFFSPLEVNEMGPSRRGGENWDEVRRDLVEELIGHFDVRHLPPWPEKLLDDPPFWTLLAGLVSFADWIGSIERYFFHLDAPTLERYADRSYERAVEALQRLGWTSFSSPQQPAEFSELFPFTPRPLQIEAIKLATAIDTPALVIVEAPTGEGKTEAALYLADRWLQAEQQRGTYIAMPTQATSNQMFGRFANFLKQRYAGGQVDLLLLHGNAALSSDMEELRLAAINQDETEGQSTVVAHSWFVRNKKRSLLAPFAVGTVDQALLSVLQTRHFFVRLFGLSHKTVIFDEIHAYDTYMSKLFQHLLSWLSRMGTSVILLSATLPNATRSELIQAYTGRASDVAPNYPGIFWATRDGVGGIPFAASATSSRTLGVAWIERSEAAVVEKVRESISPGGCVAVICNTVGRAQALYDALRDAELVPDEDLILFHARFPFSYRKAIEEQILARFDKDGAHRPERAIVVATQVIEQSLDLDFDAMLSDLAPVDLLLQRAGRLHRHQREDRPEHLADPTLMLTRPDIQEEMPVWNNDKYVYEPYVLLRTYLAIKECMAIEVPGDVPQLIAQVYDVPDEDLAGPDPALLDALVRDRQTMERHMDKDVFKAGQSLIPYPDDVDGLLAPNLQLDEDNPELHERWRALTRLVPPSVTLVCLHRQPDGRTTLDRVGERAIDLEAEPNREVAAELAQQTVNVSAYPVVHHFLAFDAPVGWQERAGLRYYRAAIFEEGRCSLQGGFTLVLDERKGLLLEKPTQ